MSKFWDVVQEVALAVIGLAILAVLVSRNSQTSSVVQSIGSGFSNALAVAEAPVTGSAANPVLSYPGAGGGFAGIG